MNSTIDLLLTYIERWEAEQIQYGLYGVWLTGGKVLDACTSMPETDARAALAALGQRGLIVRFENNADLRAWRFCSHRAETVYLVSKLREV